MDPRAIRMVVWVSQMRCYYLFLFCLRFSTFIYFIFAAGLPNGVVPDVAMISSLASTPPLIPWCNLLSMFHSLPFLSSPSFILLLLLKMKLIFCLLEFKNQRLLPCKRTRHLLRLWMQRFVEPKVDSWTSFLNSANWCTRRWWTFECFVSSIFFIILRTSL